MRQSTSLLAVLLMAAVLPGAPLYAQADKPPTSPKVKLPEWVMKERKWPVDLRVVRLSASAQRHEENGLGSVGGTETLSLSGFEASLFGPTAGPGIGARTMSGSMAAGGTFKQNEAFVDIGGRSFALEGAYVRRSTRSTVTSTALDSSSTFVSAGFHSTGRVGANGVILHLRGGYFIPLKKPADKADALEGWEGETGISYAWNRIPLTAFVGYGYQRLRLFQRAEELSSVTLGFGIWMINR
ncbi:MAG TPA: hypothetical protein VIK25_02865 [Gemmatimonadaceae bacterium]